MDDPFRQPDPAVPSDAARRTVVRLQAVSKAYGATQALDRVDLDLRAGEVLALMGANGASTPS